MKIIIIYHTEDNHERHKQRIVKTIHFRLIVLLGQNGDSKSTNSRPSNVDHFQKLDPTLLSDARIQISLILFAKKEASQNRLILVAEKQDILSTWIASLHKMRSAYSSILGTILVESEEGENKCAVCFASVRPHENSEPFCATS